MLCKNFEVQSECKWTSDGHNVAHNSKDSPFPPPDPDEVWIGVGVFVCSGAFSDVR